MGQGQRAAVHDAVRLTGPSRQRRGDPGGDVPGQEGGGKQATEAPYSADLYGHPSAVAGLRAQHDSVGVLPAEHL